MLSHFLEKLFYPRHNSVEAVGEFLQLLQVDYAKTNLGKDMEEHYDFPSLLSVSDILKSYGIENISFQVEYEKMVDIPTPFMTQMKGNNPGEPFFTVIKKIGSEKVEFFNPEKRCWQEVYTDVFLEKTSRIVLLGEVNKDVSGKSNYEDIKRSERRDKIVSYLSAALIPIIVILSTVLAFFQTGIGALFPVFFLILTLFGTLLSVLLLWYDIDGFNPGLQQVCSARHNKTVNCAAVLQSKGAKIGGIKWSEVGFVYFAGSLISLLVNAVVNSKALFILSWLNLFAVPYIVFSIFYQWRIARQWCTLCLYVQFILAAQFCLTIMGGWRNGISFNGIDQSIVISTIATFCIPILLVTLVVPAYKKAKENSINKNKLQRLKHNHEIFDALLKRQKPVVENPEGLGFILGNPNAVHKIIKVCNPYCGPCARAHPIIEDLLHSNPEVQVQMIFTAKNEENDKRATTIKHFLAIAEEDNKDKLQLALDDWYIPKDKDYSVFFGKHPVNGKLEMQGEKLTRMSDWCEKMGIRGTPTFFVNGYRLPSIYELSDLKYFLSAE